MEQDRYTEGHREPPRATESHRDSQRVIGKNSEPQRATESHSELLKRTALPVPCQIRFMLGVVLRAEKVKKPLVL